MAFASHKTIELIQPKNQGMVLLDGQPAEAFEGLPWFPILRVFHRVFAVLPTLARALYP